MTTKRLGRGLAQLIESTAGTGSSFVRLRISQIRPSRLQPRGQILESDLEELKASIKQQGVLEPIIVRPLAHGTYELVAGERRWRASQAIGAEDVPAIVKSLSDQEALAWSLIENVQREDLHPLDEGRGYARLLDEFGLTQEDIAAAVGRNRASVANMLRLLKLPETIQQGMRDGKITFGHAKVLLSVEGAAKQLELYHAAVQGQVSVRQLEAMIGAAIPRKRRRMPRADPEIRRIEEDLRQIFGTKVSLVTRVKGGRIVIEYFSDEDLQRILQVMVPSNDG